MTSFITALTGTDGISAANLWGAVTAVGSVIVTAVLFTFAYRMIRKVLKGIARGKTNM